MKLNLIALGKKMPDWVVTAYNEYANRLPKDFSLQLIEVSAQKRTKNTDINKLMHIESERLLNTVPENNTIIALDRQGETLSTKTLADQLSNYYEQSQNISLLVGGPEGISSTVLQKCDALWSLSKLTLPHPLVRVLLAEQIFRAWSIRNKHPYHR